MLTKTQLDILEAAIWHALNKNRDILLDKPIQDALAVMTDIRRSEPILSQTQLEVMYQQNREEIKRLADV